MRKLLIALSAAALVGLGGAAYAGDEEICLDCHEPAEDWEGMGVDEIVETAMDASIKRHADNAEFSEEQLRAIVTSLLGDS